MNVHFVPQAENKRSSLKKKKKVPRGILSMFFCNSTQLKQSHTMNSREKVIERVRDGICMFKKAENVLAVFTPHYDLKTIIWNIAPKCKQNATNMRNELCISLECDVN